MGDKIDLSADALWRAVTDRDRSYDGVVFYAVRTTGIFCRPQCPSRKPARANVVFFFSAQGAHNAGYRPCHRCRPDQPSAPGTPVDTVVELCRYIESCTGHLPTLQELAELVGMSPGYVQRLFRNTLGVSPRQYADWHRQARFRRALREGEGIAAATYGAGYGSGSRVYENSSRNMGMTPAGYRLRGQGLAIRYTVVPCRLGFLLAAATQKGICAVRLGDSADELTENLLEEFSRAEIGEADGRLTEWAGMLVRYLDGAADWPCLPVDIIGTAFQQRVWDFLRKIPEGETASYSRIAAELGKPEASRAVGSACAANPAALVVPCHRVVRVSGDSGSYRWGDGRKKELLALEKQKSSRHE